MKNERDYKFLKWMLDFKTIEKIHNEGFANVSVEELIKMGEEQIETGYETLENINTNYESIKQTNGEEFIKELIDGCESMIEKTQRAINYLHTFNRNLILTFRKGC